MTIESATVGGLLDSACQSFPELKRVLAVSAVWLNGEPAGHDQPVGETDEVAILPPVSGG